MIHNLKFKTKRKEKNFSISVELVDEFEKDLERAGLIVDVR